jgi:uncharacterized protein (TIGR03437 family)
MRIALIISAVLWLVSIQAAGGEIYLSSLKTFPAEFPGQELSHLSPISLVSTDFDGDGIPDLAVGYRTPKGYALGFFRGNLDAFAPQTQESLEAIGNQNYPSPFLFSTHFVDAPIQPDFLAAAGPDLFVAERGGHTLYRLTRSAEGRWTFEQPLDLEGSITALAAYRMNVRQVGLQVLVGIRGEKGPVLVLFSASLSLIKRVGLNATATAFTFGDLDGDAFPDAILLEGDGIAILHGSDYRLQYVPLTFTPASIATGAFIPNRDSRLQIAILGEDGNLHFLAHHEFDPKPWTRQELRARRFRVEQFKEIQETDDWNEIESIPAQPPALMLRTRISGQGADDILLFDTQASRITLISHPNPDENDTTGKRADAVILSRPEALQGMVAAVATRINVDGRPGIVLLKSTQPQPLVMMPLPDPTFYVNRFDDPTPGVVANTCNNGSAADNSSSCSLREAIRKANATAGVDTIIVPTGTITLSIPPVNGEHLALHGHLDILDGVNIVGAGPASTVIQAGTSAGAGIDKIFSINPNLNLAFDTSISNVTLRYGLNPFDLTGDGAGGALDWDAHGTGNLAITNCTITDNATTNGYGGGIAATWSVAGPGVLSISNSTVQRNTSTRLAPGAGLGGGVYAGANQPRLNMTNSQILENHATGNSGKGGGLFVKGPAGAVSIHNSTISANSVTGNGGGIYSDAGMTIDQGTVISANSAVDAAGIWNTLTNETTLVSNSTVTSNTATGNGGGLYLANNASGLNHQLAFNRIAGNTAAAGNNLYSGGGSITAMKNWWGTNSPAPTITGSANFDPFIVLSGSATPSGIKGGETSTITASLAQDNHGTPLPSSNLSVLFGLPSTGSVFPDTPVYGSLSAVQNQVQSTGSATELFTGTSAGTEMIHAVLDGASVAVNVSITGPPTISLNFGAGRIPVNAVTALSFTITNPNTSTLLHGIAFVDNLPSGLAVATPNGLTGSCGGGTISASAGSASIVLSGGSLSGGASCTFSVNVTASIDALQTNTTGNITSLEGGTGSTASASLLVINPPNLSASFGAPTIPMNVPVPLSFTVSNPNTSLTLDQITFLDVLPLGLLTANPTGLNGSCSGFTAWPDQQNITLLNLSLAPGSSCTFLVNVVGNYPTLVLNDVVAGSSGGNSAHSTATLTIVAPATVSMAFGASSIPLNTSALITFTLANKQNASVWLNGVGFTSALPSGLIVANPNGLTGSCPGGTINAVPGSNVVSLSGATIPKVQSCSFSVDVTGIAAGMQVGSTTAVTSIEGGSGTSASASITVVAPPALALTFGTPNLALNAATTLTFTIANPAANTVALNGVALTDNLPAGLSVPDGVSPVCGGTLSVVGGNTIVLSGATISINSSCQFSLSVTGTRSGLWNNVASPVQSVNGGAGNVGSALLAIAAPPSISLAFSATTIPFGGSGNLTYSIINPALDTVQLTGVAFSNLLPPGLVVSTPSGLSGSCGGGVIAAGNSTISLSGASIAASGSCTFTVNVTAVTVGLKSTSVSVTSNEGGPGNTAIASVAVVAPPILSKTFGASSVPLNGSTSLSFTVRNPNPISGLTAVGFSDPLPGGLSVATPNGLTGSCGGGVVTATPGSNTVAMSGATLGPGLTCSFSVNVTGTSAGDQNNITTAVSSLEGGSGAASAATITVVGPPSVATSFGAQSMLLNSTTTLNFTITAPAANTVELNGVSFADTVPSGLSLINGVGLACGGTITITNGNTLVWSAPLVGPKTVCNFSVSVKAASSGAFTNTTGVITSTNGGSGNAASATLTVSSPPVIAQSFGAAAIALGASTTLSYSVTNPGSNAIPLTGISFTDNLPSGLVVASPTGLPASCGGGIIAAAGSTVTLTGATLSPSATCTFSVNVAGNSAGPKNNSVTINSTEGGLGNTSSASITIVAPPQISTAFSSRSVPLGTTTSLSFALTNPNPAVSLSGIGFSETLPAGLAITGRSGSCAGVAITTASNSITLADAVLIPGGVCSFTVNVVGIMPGLWNISTGPVRSNEGGTSPSASDTIAVVAPPLLKKSFNTSAIALGGSATLTFSISNPNSGAQLSGIRFNDTLPDGLVGSGPAAVSTSCNGTITALAGNGTVALSNATLGVSGSCFLSVNITATTAGTKTNTTGQIVSNEGGAGLSASATLLVTTPVTFKTSPPGLSYTVDGVLYTTTQTFQWMIGTTHAIDATPLQKGTPGTQYPFLNWSDGGAAAHAIAAPGVATTFSANFGTQYQLTTMANPPNGGSIIPSSGAFFDSGQSVPLTVAPMGGYVFAGWFGQLASTSGSTATVLMDAPKTVGANFRIPSAMTADPPAVTLQYEQGTDPSVVTRTISINANGPSSFNATASESWITISGSTITPADVQVRFDRTGLTPGPYSALLTFKGVEATVTVPVSIIVTGVPSLMATPASLTFNGAGSADLLLAAWNRNVSFTASPEASWLAVSSSETQTPANLHVKADPSGLPNGTYHAVITVTSADAANSPVTIPVTLVTGQSDPGIPHITGVINGASFQAVQAAPNTILSLFGSNFCSKPQVLASGNNAEVLAATPAQINLTMPDPLPAQTSIDLQVICNGIASEPWTMLAAAVNPGIFTEAQSGTGQASVLNADFSSNGPQNPARPGSYVAVYATGLGALNAPDSTGLRTLANAVMAFIGDVECQVLYAGQAPGYTTGLQQIDIMIPSNAAPGSQPLRLLVNGIASQPGVTLTIE